MAAIDFSKAFDSIDRTKLIFALQKYKIHYKLIDSISSLYIGGKTVLNLNGKNRRSIGAKWHQAGLHWFPMSFCPCHKSYNRQNLKSKQGFKNDSLYISVFFLLMMGC